MYREPISVNEAVSRVMSYAKEGELEEVSFHECDGRRLAQSIVATLNIPSFEKSPYDGFALKSCDTLVATKKQPVQLKVVETIGAGEVAQKAIQTLQATRIMTGAELPKGTDCIIMFEECEIFTENGNDYIRISRKVEANENVMNIGSEVKEGDVLIEKGTLITPGVKAVLATFGYDRVQVVKKPLVGVIATGTELLDVDEPLEKGKIRNSNGYMITSQILHAGADFKYYGKLEDELESSYLKMKEILEEVDILITTGGVSVGDFDLIPAIYEKLGAQLLFNKVSMRPGSVTTVAVRGEQLLFGLSGNPSACYVGFELFTRPVIQTALFNPRPYLRKAKATLQADFPKANPFTRFVRTYYTFDQERILVDLSGIDKSNAVSSLAHVTSLMILPGGTSEYTKGDLVDILLLNDPTGEETFLI